MPYIVSVLCSFISGTVTYLVSRKQTKADLEKIEKQHSLDIKKEREVFKLEKEKMQLEHQYQLEMMQKQFENQLGSDLMGTMVKEVIKMPEFKNQILTNKKRK